MRGLKDLNSENMTLKRLVSELNLERLVLKCFPALRGWYVFRFIVTLICLAFAASSRAQSVQLMDAPKPSASLLASSTSVSDSSSTADLTGPSDLTFSLDVVQTSQSTPDANHGDPHPTPSPNVPQDANGNPIPLNRQQPQRILGFMPNFRSVSGGATPHPPGWNYNFQVATRQALAHNSRTDDGGHQKCSAHELRDDSARESIDRRCDRFLFWWPASPGWRGANSETN